MSKAKGHQQGVQIPKRKPDETLPLKEYFDGRQKRAYLPETDNPSICDMDESNSVLVQTPLGPQHPVWVDGTDSIDNFTRGDNVFNQNVLGLFDAGPESKRAPDSAQGGLGATGQPSQDEYRVVVHSGSKIECRCPGLEPLLAPMALKTKSVKNLSVILTELGVRSSDEFESMGECESMGIASKKHGKVDFNGVFEKKEKMGAVRNEQSRSQGGMRGGRSGGVEIHVVSSSGREKKCSLWQKGVQNAKGLKRRWKWDGMSRHTRGERPDSEFE